MGDDNFLPETISLYITSHGCVNIENHRKALGKSGVTKKTQGRHYLVYSVVL